MILDNELKNLEVYLGATVTTNELPITVAYADHGTETFTPGCVDGETAGETPVVILAAPAAGIQRQLKYASIYNADTVAATVYVQLNNDGTSRIICKALLDPEETLQYSPDWGWFK